MQIGTIHQVFDHGDGIFTVDFDLIKGENIERIEYGLSASSDDAAPVHVALKQMYSDGDLDSFIIPVPTVDMASYKSAAVKRVAAFSQQIIEPVIGDVPQIERDSWGSKEMAARAHQAASATTWEITLLQAEASMTGETLDELSARIITNADIYKIIVGKITGIRREATTAIMDVEITNAEDVDDIVDAAQTLAEDELAAILAA